MEYATLGDIDERLTEIDALLLKGAVGDLHLSPAERSQLESEGEAILQILTRELAKHQNVSPEEIYEMRQKIRSLDYIAGVTEKYLKLHPEPNPENDRIISTAVEGLKNGTKTNEEAAREIAAVFAPVFPSTVGESRAARAGSTKKKRILRLLVAAVVILGSIVILVLLR